MSYKTTDAAGNAAGYSGTDFSPGELDPLGGNMGTETPYQEPLNTTLTPTDLVGQTNFLIDGGDQPMMVYGQRLTCVVDGIAWEGGCRDAFSRVGSSLDIDFANTSRNVLTPLGIFAIRTVYPGSNSIDPTPSTAPDTETPVGTGGRNERVVYQYFGLPSWNGRGQQSQTQQQTNPSCITNAIPGSRLTTDPKEMIEPDKKWDNNLNDFVYNPSKNDHDGVHILNPTRGLKNYNVTALPAMEGTVLHYNKQTANPPFYSNLDIQLNISLNGEPLVLTIKDMIWVENAYKPGDRIKDKQTLGVAENKFKNAQGEVTEASGIHVTLMTLSTYKNYVLKGGKTGAARKSVPISKLMDAYNDPNSPFRCP